MRETTYIGLHNAQCKSGFYFHLDTTVSVYLGTLQRFQLIPDCNFSYSALCMQAEETC